jgi:hypothetical protein
MTTLGLIGHTDHPSKTCAMLTTLTAIALGQALAPA